MRLSFDLFPIHIKLCAFLMSRNHVFYKEKSNKGIAFICHEERHRPYKNTTNTAKIISASLSLSCILKKTEQNQNQTTPALAIKMAFRLRHDQRGPHCLAGWNLVMCAPLLVSLRFRYIVCTVHTSHTLAP